MIKKVNIHEAKTHLSRLLGQVAKGDEVVIAHAGKPVARLVSVVNRPAKRVAGTAKGKIVISKDFEKPLPKSLLKAFGS